jgi:hypothetical protein
MKRLFVAAAVLGVGIGARAATTPGVRATHGIESQQYLGTGKGVTVSVLDAGVDVTHPALRGSVYAEKDFTGQNYVDDDKFKTGHGTGIAGVLIGHDGKVYSGLAPAAKLINARVITADDFTSNLWAGNGLMWSAQKGARVINISFGNKVGDTSKGSLTDKFTLMTDYVAEKYGANVVVAAGNENDTAVRQVPGGLYNGYSVGALSGPTYQRPTDFSNYALDNDARTKPDLVAPGHKVDVASAEWEKSANYINTAGTSYAAPMVGGVLAQMIGYGKSHDLSVDPMLLKAILMTSATKGRDYDGTPWAPRRGMRDEDYGRLYTRPLDDEQGAGAVNALDAYRVYAKKKAGTTAMATWKEGTLKGNETYEVKLGKLKAGQRLDATLTWLRHVGYKDVNDNGPDGRDDYFHSASLADFTLSLLKDGVPVAGSDSDVDNLEHLSWKLTESANYSLAVYRFVDGGMKDEDFAIAARAYQPAAATSSSPNTVSRGLAFEGGGGLRGFDGVPEPGTAAGVAGALIFLGRRGQRAVRS